MAQLVRDVRGHMEAARLKLRDEWCAAARVRPWSRPAHGESRRRLEACVADVVERFPRGYVRAVSLARPPPRAVCVRVARP